MDYELGRFVWWLDHNSVAIEAAAGAIQAFTSVVIGVLTLYLLRFTRTSVAASQRSAETTERQLRVAVQPLVNASFTSKLNGSSSYDGGPIKHFLVGEFFIENKGGFACKIEKLTFVFSSYAVEKIDYAGRVLYPGLPVREQYADVEVNQAHVAERPALRINCADLLGITYHEFTINQTGAITHVEVTERQG
jgi:hypothetical protein